MSLPMPPRDDTDDKFEKSPGDPVTKTGTYQANHKPTGDKLGRKELHYGTDYPGWPPYPDREVIWSSRPVRTLSEEPGRVADNAAVAD